MHAHTWNTSPQVYRPWRSTRPTSNRKALASRSSRADAEREEPEAACPGVAPEDAARSRLPAPARSDKLSGPTADTRGLEAMWKHAKTRGVGNADTKTGQKAPFDSKLVEKDWVHGSTPKPNTHWHYAGALIPNQGPHPSTAQHSTAPQNTARTTLSQRGSQGVCEGQGQQRVLLGPMGRHVGQCIRDVCTQAADRPHQQGQAREGLRHLEHALRQQHQARHLLHVGGLAPGRLELPPNGVPALVNEL